TPFVIGVTSTALALAASLATQTSFEAKVTQGSVKVPLPVIVVVEQVVTDGHTSPTISEPVPPVSVTATLPEPGTDSTALAESWSLPRQIELGVMPGIVPELGSAPVLPERVTCPEMLVGGQSIPTISPGVPVTVTIPLLTTPTSTALVLVAS